MSDRDATAETKEPYALARCGLPLRGIAPAAPRARWLPPVVRAQAVQTSRVTEPTIDEANPLDDSEFDPFAIAAPSAAPSPQFAPSPLIRDASAVLSIIADEGFEREAPASMPSRAIFDSADDPAPRISPEIADTPAAEMRRPRVSVANEPSTQPSARDPFAPIGHDMSAMTDGGMPSASPMAVDVSAPSETMRTAAAPDGANTSTPRGAIASREREIALIAPMAPIASSSPIAMASPRGVVSDARQVDSAPVRITDSNIPDADAHFPDSATQALDPPHGETATSHPSRDIDEARNNARAPSRAALRHETVEMGTPSAALPMPRESGDTQARTFATPRPLDAAQIAALLSPIAASNAANGPSVTIDRVQVTVQTPAAARPAAMPAPQASASAQRQAAASGSRNSSYQNPGYQNPWASYFARRD